MFIFYLCAKRSLRLSHVRFVHALLIPAHYIYAPFSFTLTFSFLAKQIKSIENEIDLGQIEEVIEMAKDELKLIDYYHGAIALPCPCTVSCHAMSYLI